MKARSPALVPCLACLLLSIITASCSRLVVENKPILTHQHHAPHEGTAVVLGKEQYHLELVCDATDGTLTAYVLDSEMDNFIRLAQPNIILSIKTADYIGTLTLHAVANTATGEKIGDTSEFQVKDELFKKTSAFDGILKLITVNNNTFLEVSFNFPRGNDQD